MSTVIIRALMIFALAALVFATTVAALMGNGAAAGLGGFMTGSLAIETARELSRERSK